MIFLRIHSRKFFSILTLFLQLFVFVLRVFYYFFLKLSLRLSHLSTLLVDKHRDQRNTAAKEAHSNLVKAILLFTSKHKETFALLFSAYRRIQVD